MGEARGRLSDDLGYTGGMHAASHEEPPRPRTEDQRIFFHDVTWSQYEFFLAMRGDQAGVRVIYLDGVLELMSPSSDHEATKKTLARLVEAYAEERDLDLNGVGSWTVKKALAKRGLEPDECYILGPRRSDHPDLAIEVIWTSGGLDKLEVYRGLGVPEVWLWRAGAITVHRLRDGQYYAAERSGFLPDLDLPHLLGFLDLENQTSAVRAYRAALRER